MLKEARKNCQSCSLKNVELLKSDDTLSNVSGTFDFVHSFIVFQHIPPKRGEVILSRLIDHLEPGGIAALHFTYFRRASLIQKAKHWMRKSVPIVNNLANLKEGRDLFYPMMPMNTYNLNKILLLLLDRGCEDSYIRFTTLGCHLGAILFFQKRP